MKKVLLYSGTILAFFIVGILVANFIIMPLIVHRGKEVLVPNVCNLDLENALQALKERDLDGIVSERRHDQVIEEGKVIIQGPLPDEKVKAGRIINLTISLGPQIIKIPYLSDVDVEKGSFILRRLGFVIEEVDSVFSDSILDGKIIRTIPEPETELQKGNAVKIIVSKGRVLKMPNLAGKDLGDIKIILDKIGLVLGTVKKVEGSGVKGSIIIQNPEPGQEVSSGDTVTLMVTK